ncbi:MAG: AAA family ATPase [Burkholderiaceae bacterium]|nr:AAA family ATPase [Burkholderiaceae bacterium]
MIPIDWLWPDWLAQGKMHLLAGAPGQGKTTIALAMAATVSNGGVWPDGKPCAPGSVLVWTCEDDPGDTLNPRLAGMGADLKRIHYVQGTRLDDGRERAFDPAADMPMLLADAQAIGDVRLIVVDPIVTAVSGDSHRNAEVRQGLQPLVTLADKLGAAVLGITHLSKGSAGREPTERVIGSIAFAAVARVVLLAAKVKGEDGEDKRVLVRSKSNIGPDDGGFQYHIEQVQVHAGIDASIVTWGEAINGTARELLAEAEDEPDSDASDVADLLRSELDGGEWVPADTAITALARQGLSRKQVWAASKKLGVIRKRSGFGQKGAFYWRLPGGTVSELPGDFPIGSTIGSIGSVHSEREPMEPMGAGLDLPEGVQENAKASNKKGWTPSGNLDTFGNSDLEPPASLPTNETTCNATTFDDVEEF